MLKQEQHIVHGMTRDLTVSKFNPEFAYECKNIRITARDESTLLTVTNEKGNKEIPLQSPSGDPVVIDGVLLGQNVLNNYVTLFTKGANDNIYRLENKGTYFEAILLFSGNLNFSTDYPIENIGIYENNNIQKVYWVDGLNQARVINIMKDTYTNSDDFDFVGTIHTNSTIKVDKVNGAGSFNQGVIQYAFTYYNKYGKETNVFRTSPLLYISHVDRGASPEESVDCSFNITMNNLDTSYEYIRVYSIHRTSIDSTPTVKLVADLTTATQLYVDTGNVGETVDPTLLLYIGGEEIVPYTMAQKDNTLFLGNYTLKRTLIPPALKTQIKNNSSVTFNVTEEAFNFNTTEDTQYNSMYELNFNSTIKGFQKGEVYRLGMQFQDDKGKWSEVVFIGDYECNRRFSFTQYDIFGLMLKPVAKVTITDAATIQSIKDLGYVNARGVVVFPSLEDRNILCQGILCPTVANYKDRLDNSPFAQSSWFSRPKQPTENWKTEYTGTNHKASFGEIPYFQHNEPIGSASVSEITRWEIQTSLGLIPYYNPNTTNPTDYVDGSPSEFLVDENIVTMHSPDVEFDDRLQTISNGNYKLRIIGVTNLTNTLSDISVTTSTPTFSNYATGFYKGKVANKLISAYQYGGRQLTAGMFWSDTIKYETDFPDDKAQRLWMVFPWHRNGSLMNMGVPEAGQTRAAALQRKIISNLKFSSFNSYIPNQNVWDAEISGDADHTGITPVNSWTEGLVRIPSPVNSGLGYLNYYANIDKILTFNRSDKVSEVYKNGYLIYTTRNWTENGQNASLFDNATNQAVELNSAEPTELVIKNADMYGTEPVSMKYKSTPHLVFAFNFTNTGEQVAMPMLNLTNPAVQPPSGTHPFWYNNIMNASVYQDSIHMLDVNTPFFWLAELYRDNVVNRFGGDTEEAILNNTWLPSGDATPIGNNINIIYSEGDTYYQRYDCLKTYASTNEDQNSIVDIVSFMCETKINIDGRYDRNRGQVNNLAVSPTNFNLFNPVYSQRNNYFTFRTVDYERFNLNYFPNSITLTKEKQLGEDVDTWTNITLATTLDLDGDKGEVVSLNTFRNEIFAFQRMGLSNILFNSRVQIPTSDGMPIEITNGLKLNGKRYISNTIGCANKWSIVESPSGLYFIDNETNSLYLFNGEITSLSDKLGFRQWINAHNVHVNWEPVGYNNYRSFYDKNNNDVYFTYKDHCLCYSELINQFTSFMSYEQVPAMFNVSSEFYAFKDGKMWEQFSGDYNMFFGQYQPYSITVVANADEPADKIFNTVEFRADAYDGDNLAPTKTYDTLDVYNEYQHGRVTLTDLNGRPSPLKRKFRIWRANIPRANISINGISANNRDRIRNTWAYVKLSTETPNTYRTVFHDMTIHYYV